MNLFQVMYESNDMWFTAGFVFANNENEAMTRVLEKNIDYISLKTGKTKVEIISDLNLDCNVVTTIDDEVIEKK